VAERIGMEFAGNKAKGYWDNVEHFDRELLAFIKEYGTPGVMPRKIQLWSCAS